MATFELQGPDGGTYEVEAPDEGKALDAFKRMQAPSPPPTGNTGTEYAHAPLTAAAGASGEIVTPLDDLSRSINTGLAKGVATWIGGPAALASGAQHLVTLGQSFVQGRPYEEVQAENDKRAVISRETLDRFGPGAMERVLREHTPNGAEILDYEPKTVPGEYAKTIGEFLPAGALNPVASVVSALGSETLGQLTKGTPAEPYARMAGAVAAPGVAGRVISPTRVPAARQPAVQALEAEGVPLTAGDRSGSRQLQWLESATGDAPFSGGAAERLADRKGRAFNRAVARHMGEDADLLTPEVMQRSADRLGNEFRTLSARNTLQYDAQMGRDINNVSQEYWNSMQSGHQPIFANMRQDIIDHLRSNQATIPGDLYQKTRSRLSRMSNSYAQNDPELSRALGGLRDALDEGMARSIRPEDAAAWATARQQYGNMRAVEQAMAGAGSQAAQGFVSPSQLRSAIASRNRPVYVRGQSDIGNLARSGEAVLRPLAQSGTSPREQATNVIRSAAHLLGAGAAGGAVGGLPGVVSGIAALAAPGVAGRVLLNPWTQAILQNQLVQPDAAGRLARLGRATSRALIAASH
jgi:hypothetical protein